MPDLPALCELHRLSDVGRPNAVVDALEARGIESDVWDESGGLSLSVHPGSALMVRCRDLVYARWIADAMAKEARGGVFSRRAGAPAGRGRGTGGW